MWERRKILYVQKLYQQVRPQLGAFCSAPAVTGGCKAVHAGPHGAGAGVTLRSGCRWHFVPRPPPMQVTKEDPYELRCKEAQWVGNFGAVDGGPPTRGPGTARGNKFRIPTGAFVL